MVNFWLTTHHAYHCNYVKTQLTVNMLVIYIMIGCQPQIPHFLIVNSHLWFHEHTITTGFHFDKNHDMAIQSYNINVTVPRVPVTLNNYISFPPKKLFRTLLAPSSKFIMCCHDFL